MLRGCREVAISGFRQDFNDPLIVWFVPFLLPPTPPLSNTLFARDHQTTFNLQFPRPSNLCSSLIPLALSGMTFQVTRRLSSVVRRRSGHTRRHRTELKFQEDDPLPPPSPALLPAPFPRSCLRERGPWNHPRYHTALLCPRDDPTQEDAMITGHRGWWSTLPMIKLQMIKCGEILALTAMGRQGGMSREEQRSDHVPSDRPTPIFSLASCHGTISRAGNTSFGWVA